MKKLIQIIILDNYFTHIIIKLYKLRNKKETKRMWKNLFLVVIQFATNVQLKYLINKFCPWISFHKLYKKGFFLFVHIKIQLSIWDEFKKALK